LHSYEIVIIDDKKWGFDYSKLVDIWSDTDDDSINNDTIEIWEIIGDDMNKSLKTNKNFQSLDVGEDI
jgi:hypothetical protein